MSSQEGGSNPPSGIVCFARLKPCSDGEWPNDLAHDLLVSLGGPADAGAAQVWEAEITRRLDDLQSGDVQAIEAKRCAESMLDCATIDLIKSGRATRRH
jgi:hypothetical protein